MFLCNIPPSYQVGGSMLDTFDLGMAHGAPGFGTMEFLQVAWFCAPDVVIYFKAFLKTLNVGSCTISFAGWVRPTLGEEWSLAIDGTNPGLPKESRNLWCQWPSQNASNHTFWSESGSFIWGPWVFPSHSSISNFWSFMAYTKWQSWFQKIRPTKCRPIRTFVVRIYCYTYFYLFSTSPTVHVLSLLSNCWIVVLLTLAIQKDGERENHITQQFYRVRTQFHISPTSLSGNHRQKMAKQWLFWSAFVLLALGHDVDLPGCPFEKLTGFCKGSATCHGLAHSGLTCEGLANIAECATFCAYPCCNSATTSTATTTTFTTHTHTFTETSSSTTTISTITSTTVTVPTTVTSTASTTTTTQTDFMDSTTSIDVSGGPAAVMKISMRVEVTDPQDYLQYFDDDAVQAAYINVMSTVASIPKNLVELERTSSELGYLTMTYVITIPYTNDTPSIPVAPVQEKLSSIDIPTFNEMLDAEMREVPGALKILEASRVSMFLLCRGVEHFKLRWW